MLTKFDKRYIIISIKKVFGVFRLSSLVKKNVKSATGKSLNFFSYKIKCPHCGTIMFSHKKRCPKCGHHVKVPFYMRRIVVYLLMFIIVFLLALVYFSETNETVHSYLHTILSR